MSNFYFKMFVARKECLLKYLKCIYFLINLLDKYGERKIHLKLNNTMFLQYYSICSRLVGIGVQ